MFTRIGSFRRSAFLVALFITLASLPASARAAGLPTDFTDTLVARVASPTALAFTPDGRLLITSQPGKLLVYQNGALAGTPALDLGSKLCTNSERGLLGVATDPNFTTNHYLYLYYTFNKFNTCPFGQPTNPHDPVDRVSRFVLGDNNVVDPRSEVVLLDNIVSPNGTHNAGDLHFGPDGNLYISVGDGGCDYAGDSGCAGDNDATRDQNILLGKILRVTPDGGIPADNPFLGNDSARCNVNGRANPGKKCQEIFAWGFRNPFRFAFDPNAREPRFFINDVGQNLWEEIDEGVKGADYGWNIREGFCANGSKTDCRSTPGAVVNGLTDPIYAYGHDTGYAITGGAFVPNGVWPAAYSGNYLFGDYSGKIMRLVPDGQGGYTRDDFATALGNSSVVTMIFGPSPTGQSLFYTSYANGGQVHRIDYTGHLNRPPVAVMTANPTFGPTPLTVSFDGSASSDPDGDMLTYLWDFGDGSLISESSSPTINHTYMASGVYTASLTVRDANGALSDAVMARIDAGNSPPTATITSPMPDMRFAVGQTLTLHASATDAEDGPLPDTALSWRVLLRHADHTHPFLEPTTGNSITLTAPAPEDLLAATNSYLEIELTATDSQGLQTTVRQNVLPHTIPVTFNTEPGGLKLIVNGTTLTGTATITSWEGYQLHVNAPDQATSSGQSYGFAAWSDGGTAAHTIITPSTAVSYTATFSATGAQQAVTSFSLINADTGQPLSGFDPLPDGANLDLATLPTRNLSIRANTLPTTVGSVGFAYDGNQSYQIENIPPYAIAGDTNGGAAYRPWTPGVGDHTLTATPYTGSKLSGMPGASLTVHFHVSDGAARAGAG